MFKYIPHWGTFYIQTRAEFKEENATLPIAVLFNHLLIYSHGFLVGIFAFLIVYVLKPVATRHSYISKCRTLWLLTLDIFYTSAHAHFLVHYFLVIQVQVSQISPL